MWVRGGNTLQVFNFKGYLHNSEAFSGCSICLTVEQKYFGHPSGDQGHTTGPYHILAILGPVRGAPKLKPQF